MTNEITIPIALVILGLLLAPFMILLIDLGFYRTFEGDPETTKRKEIITFTLGAAVLVWMIYLSIATGMFGSVRIVWLP